MSATIPFWSRTLPLIAALIIAAGCGGSSKGGSSEDPCRDQACTKLVASNASSFDYFGESVAARDDMIVAGAPLQDDAGSNAGAAYVYRPDGPGWDEEAILIASDASPGDWFGNSVDLSGDAIIVGALFGDATAALSNNEGAAYVFRESGNDWVEEARLESSDGGAADNFGTEVAISGDVAVVGAPLRNSAGLDSGSAYVFTFDGTLWNETAILTASDAAAEDGFGTSVAIDGDVIAVGAPGLNNDGVTAAFAADIDGDGDLDVVTASNLDEQIAWFENTDGEGTFGTQHFISTGITDGLVSVYAADIDDDDDMDVLSASTNDDTIAWYENLDGNGNFGAQQVISTGADFASSVIAADVDGDDDIDVLSASFNDDKIAWYENTDGDGTFGVEQVISTAANGAQTVFAEDIDGDDDIDVLSASFNDDRIAWYENTDGAGTFGVQQVISTAGNGARSVIAIDIDGDDDLDVVSGSELDNDVTWFENTDGLGDFGSGVALPSIADFVTSVIAADFDGDGDADIVVTSVDDEQIAYFENKDGLGDFGDQQLISTATQGASSAAAADFDGDGDLDLLFATSLALSASGSHHDDKIGWHRNLDGRGTFGDEITITTPGSAGSAYVYRFDGANWIEERIFAASDLGDTEDFGHSVAVSDDVILVSTSLDDEGVAASPSENPGAVYVYRHDGAAWNEEQTIRAEDAEVGQRDLFGIDAALSPSADTIVVGSRRNDDDPPSAGSAHLLNFQAGEWSHESQLRAPDTGPLEIFGDSVAITADNVVIGATFDEQEGERAGAVYIFER